VRWNLSGILICISFMASNGEHFCMCLEQEGRTGVATSGKGKWWGKGYENEYSANNVYTCM
jgi:hypothetical protein